LTLGCVVCVCMCVYQIYQWDTRTGQVCQEYNYHLQPCNTVTFFDEGRKFISTSDDK